MGSDSMYRGAKAYSKVKLKVEVPQAGRQEFILSQ